MKQVTYKTLAECEAAIRSFKVMEIEIPDWMEKQYKELKAAQNTKSVVANTDTPIYDTLVANYPYGKMPEEKIKCIQDTVNPKFRDYLI